jgi:hypothetical protein
LRKLTDKFTKVIPRLYRAVLREKSRIIISLLALLVVFKYVNDNKTLKQYAVPMPNLVKEYYSFLIKLWDIKDNSDEK